MTTKIVYGVPYIESEADWGQRPFGWRLYTDLSHCIARTKQDRRNGYKNGVYLGPTVTMLYYEIPSETLEGLDNDDLERLQKSGMTGTPDRWEPRFKSEAYVID